MRNLRVRQNFWPQGQEKTGQQEKSESPSEDGKAYSQKGEGKESSRQTERDIAQLKEAREILSACFLR
jgi:hypothetical protein